MSNEVIPIKSAEETLRAPEAARRKPRACASDWMEAQLASARNADPMLRACERVTIVMPCLDEAETLATCIDKARRGLLEAGVMGEVLARRLAAPTFNAYLLAAMAFSDPRFVANWGRYPRDGGSLLGSDRTRRD